MKIDDLTAEFFGNLQVIRKVGKTKSNEWVWACRCCCDAVIYVRSSALLCGRTRSCGCQKHFRAGRKPFDCSWFLGVRFTAFLRGETLPWELQTHYGHEADPNYDPNSLF